MSNILVMTDTFIPEGLREYLLEVANDCKKDPECILSQISVLCGHFVNKQSFLALSMNGYYYSLLGLSEIGLFLANKALNEFEGSHTKGELSCLTINGLIYINLGNYSTASNFLTKALTIAKDLNDLESLIMCNINLCSCYNELNEYDKSIQCSQQTLDLIKPDHPGYLGWKARCHGNLANSYRYKGKLKDALTEQIQALDISKKLSDKMEIAANYLDLGELYRFMGEYDEALKCYDESYKVAKNMGYKRGIAQYYRNKGIIYRLKKDYDKSIEYTKTARDIFIEIGDQEGITGCNINLANVYGDKSK